MKKLPEHIADRLPKWFWKLPFVWRLKFDFYHEQFIPPVKKVAHKKILPYVKYDVQENGDIVWNPYSGPNFRCPYCGQAHELRFTYEAMDLRLKQDKMLQKVWLERHENGALANTYEPGTPMFGHYVNPLVNMIDIPCHHCKETAPKWRWTHAFQNPLLYFHTEHVCHCGGEMYFQPDALGNHYLMCDECGWVNPGSGISGAERID